MYFLTSSTVCELLVCVLVLGSIMKIYLSYLLGFIICSVYKLTMKNLYPFLFPAAREKVRAMPWGEGGILKQKDLTI